jgi:hypothetical protein
MPKVLTTEEFAAKAKEIFGDKYTYENSKYTRAKELVKVNCREHGEWETTPDTLLRKKAGCPTCRIVTASERLRMPREEFITRSEEIHPGRFLYDEVVYKNNRTKVKVYCKAHEEYFQITPTSLLAGCGCELCGRERIIASHRISKEDFVERAKNKHGDKYVYDDIEFVDCKTPVEVHCTSHGVFSITPTKHILGSGCKKCYEEKRGFTLHLRAKSEFLEKAKVIAPQYDYSKTEYVRSNKKVVVTCLKHEDFEITPSGILSGKGCPACAAESRPLVKRQNAAKAFVSRALLVPEHQGRGYTYTRTVYTGTFDKLIVTCPIHEDFEVTPNNHLRGRGCPDCQSNGYRRSKPGILYVLADGEITKVGITNYDALDRAKSVSKDSGRKFDVLYQNYQQDGRIPCNVETILLRELRKQYKQPKERFEGYTECFFHVNQAALLNRIESLISEQNSLHNQDSQESTLPKEIENV